MISEIGKQNDKANSNIQKATVAFAAAIPYLV